MTEEDHDRIQEAQPAPSPTGADIAGPGTVRQGSGYSGSTSGGVEVDAGHDVSPYDPPSAGYMGDTTASDERAEIVIQVDDE
jgi:hypothetical protein